MRRFRYIGERRRAPCGTANTTCILIAGACLLIAASAGSAPLSVGKLPSWTSPTPPIDAQALAKSEARLAAQAAETAEKKGKDEDAIRLYEQARVLDPQWNHLSRRLAVLYDRRGDDERAKSAYKQAIAMAPNDADLLNDFGVFHLHREQWSAAESWFRRALTAQPNYERAAMNLGMSLAMQGRLKESHEAFSRVVGPAAAYSNLGVLLARQGRIDEARDHLQRALALDGEIQQAREFLANLDRFTSPSSMAIDASYAERTPQLEKR